MNSGLTPKVGLVGCGYWGRNLARNFREIGALAQICEADVARHAELEKTYGVPLTTQYLDLLSNPEIRGVVIAAPAAQHFSLAKQALLAGKDVFVEKPLALRVDDGEELLDLAKKQSRVLMVGHLLHYHPAIVELRRLIRAGELGRIEYISSSRLNLGKLRTEEDILWSFAPHDISAIVHLLEENPTTVASQGGSYLNHPISDVTLTFLNFSSGVKAHIFVSWLHPFKEQKLVVVGDRKMAVFDDTQADTKLVLYPHRIDWIDRVPVARRMEGEAVSLEPKEPLRTECEHFLECIVTRKTPNTDGENGLRVLKVLHAASESLREHGKPVPLQSAPTPKYYVDPTAILDQPCTVGDGTKIWHFSHVMSNCQIGEKCNFGQNVHVASGVRIGNNVKIQNNVSVYAGVELEDDVFCGPSMVFTNVLTPRSHVNRRAEYTKTLVKRGASLGANSTIVCGVTIGRFAFVGAGAVVTKDVPDHAIMAGVPARRIGWACECGVRLAESSQIWSCSRCGSAFQLADSVMRRVEPERETRPEPEERRAFAATAGQD
ncbi:MAG: Gfo/Idh/MocA family oxidoreductase [Candidatus Acidiferrum sp.]